MKDILTFQKEVTNIYSDTEFKDWNVGITYFLRKTDTQN
jgi:hypothetical protein